jgi:hypothetical protein
MIGGRGRKTCRNGNELGFSPRVFGQACRRIGMRVSGRVEPMMVGTPNANLRIKNAPFSRLSRGEWSWRHVTLRKPEQDMTQQLKPDERPGHAAVRTNGAYGRDAGGPHGLSRGEWSWRHVTLRKPEQDMTQQLDRTNVRATRRTNVRATRRFGAPPISKEILLSAKTFDFRNQDS